jgi:YYY domain-containing protein
MLSFFLWYLIITTLGLLTFPLAFHLLPALPDRGYAFSRALGWLLWGFIFWLLGSFGLLGNNLGGQLVAALMLLALSVTALRHVGWDTLRAWLQSRMRLVLTVEILFLLSFAAWTVVRAANPEIVGTEKPMELAFINAILRSPNLPPHDPWLSGFAISYYYFGYVLVAMLARLAGTAGGVAFNLAVSLIFGLSAIGAYGILYNLLASHLAPRTPHASSRTSNARPRPSLRALLGPFFLLIVSNLGGLLHLLRLGGVFWRRDETGQFVSPVWAWLDIGRFSQPPPDQPFPHWWWWQASRLVQDFDFNMVNKGDIIDEFPFFSYLLGDLHPHVLAMPFALLAVGLALNLILGGADGSFPWPRLRIRPTALALGAVVFGGMAFLNTWDFPFYVALFAGAYALRPPKTSDQPDQPERSAIDVLKDFVLLGVTLGIAGMLLYLPFFVSFSSQAGGLLPNLIYVTRGVYFWLMFAPLLVPLFAFLLKSWRTDADLEALKRGLVRTLVIVLMLLLLSFLIAAFISIVHVFSAINPEAATAGNVFLNSQGAPSWAALFRESLIRRLTVPGTLLSLVALLALTITMLWPRAFPHPPRRPDSSLQAEPAAHPASLFVFLLVFLGALLVLTPEFIYLRDLFGYRINTIFKFYYVAWLLWSLAAAYATVQLWSRLRSPWRGVFRISLVVVLVLALIYPVLGLWSKTNRFNPSQWRLDGTAYLQTSAPDEAAAMQWLQDAPLGVVAEAVGGSYTTFARMATHSGQPTVLGWEFHEVQWRGDVEKLGSRRADIERLYCTPTWSDARQILDQYEIHYVVVGSRERMAYATGSTACPAGLREAKFATHLPVAFQQGDVTIYEVPVSK